MLTRRSRHAIYTSRMSERIEVVVFDLGGVLIDVDHQRAIDWLLERGCRVGALEDFVEHTGMDAHERGELDTAGFLARVNALLRDTQSPAELERWWTSLFSARETMLDCVRSLRANYRVCILSNTGELHWSQARRQFALDALVDDALTSFEAGVAKPDLRIYELAAQRFAAQPDRTVFIDDRPENATGARAAGWHAIHHTDDAATLAALATLGVRAD